MHVSLLHMNISYQQPYQIYMRVTPKNNAVRNHAIHTEMG